MVKALCETPATAVRVMQGADGCPSCELAVWEVRSCLVLLHSFQAQTVSGGDSNSLVAEVLGASWPSKLKVFSW